MSKTEKLEMICMAPSHYPSTYLVKERDETPRLGSVGNSCRSLMFTSSLICFASSRMPPCSAAVHLPGASVLTLKSAAASLVLVQRRAFAAALLPPPDGRALQ